MRTRMCVVRGVPEMQRVGCMDFHTCATNAAFDSLILASDAPSRTASLNSETSIICIAQ